MWLSQSLEPHPWGINRAFGSGVNEQVVEKPAESAAEERGDHWNCHRIAVSIASETMLGTIERSESCRKQE